MHSVENRTIRCVLPLLLGLAFAGCAAEAEEASEEDLAGLEVTQALHFTKLPPELAVPAGNKLSLWLQARGVQVYACRPAQAGGYAWAFVEPEADLYGPLGLVKVGYHYAGPTWELKDGSSVQAARVAGVTVDPTAIPWLLLSATTHSGDGLLSEVTYVQRLYTAGGLAPSTGCDADHLEETVDVPYTATYAFYR